MIEIADIFLHTAYKRISCEKVNQTLSFYKMVNDCFTQCHKLSIQQN